jgi:hypothetical protein
LVACAPAGALMAADSNVTVATMILHIGMVAPMALSARSSSVHDAARRTLCHRPQSSEIERRRQAHAQAAALMEERNAQRVK